MAGANEVNAIKIIVAQVKHEKHFTMTSSLLIARFNYLTLILSFTPSGIEIKWDSFQMRECFAVGLAIEVLGYDDVDVRGINFKVISCDPSRGKKERRKIGFEGRNEE